MEITLKKLYVIQEKVVVFENKNKKLQEQLMIIKDKVMTVINLVQKVKEIKKKNEKIENYMKQINSTLSVLESYAKHFGCKSNVYNVYDNVNFESVKDKEHLKDPIVAQLVYLNLAYIKYSNKCGPYTFPHKMNQQQIISEINQWKGYVPQQDKVYYDTAVQILQGKKGEQFISFAKLLGNDSEQNSKLNRQQLNTVLDTKFDRVINAVRGIANSHNPSYFINNYKRDEQAFIMEYEKHLQQYQLYWYRNSKTEHQRIMNELYNLIYQATLRAGNIFNRFWDCLNGSFN